MKSVVMKSIYAGLGLLGTGKESVEEIGRKLAKQASLSEKDGEKIARQLRSKSEKAINSLQKTLESEVKKVVNALHPITGGTGKGGKKRSKSKSAKTTPRHRPTAKKKSKAG
ncbi:MAG TPA: hypothetical protein VFE47_10445 [Tepidisphaeraceae bacterium]|jgi:hypothetical protein|nr:hypothetical protein [Tepidisphaeraceae bacterium]